MDPRKLILICHSGGQFIPEQGSLSYKYNGGVAHAVDINQHTSYHDLNSELADTCNFDLKTLSIKYFLPGNTRTLITVSNDKDLRRMIDFYGATTTAECYIVPKETLVRDFPTKLTPTRRSHMSIVAIGASGADISGTEAVGIFPAVTASAPSASTEPGFSSENFCLSPLVTLNAPSVAGTMPTTLPFETVAMSTVTTPSAAASATDSSFPSQTMEQSPITVTTPSAAAADNSFPSQTMEHSPITVTTLSAAAAAKNSFSSQTMEHSPITVTTPSAAAASNNNFSSQTMEQSPSVSATSLIDVVTQATVFSVQYNTPSATTLLPDAVMAPCFPMGTVTSSSITSATALPADSVAAFSFPVEKATPSPDITPTTLSPAAVTSSSVLIETVIPSSAVGATTIASGNPISTPASARTIGLTKEKTEKNKARRENALPLPTYVIALPASAACPSIAGGKNTPKTSRSRKGTRGVSASKENLEGTCAVTPPPTTPATVHANSNTSTPVVANPTHSATVIDHAKTIDTPAAAATASAQTPFGASTSSIHLADSIGKRTRSATRRFAGIDIYTIKEDVMQQVCTGPNGDVMQQGSTDPNGAVMQQGSTDSNINKLDEMNGLNTVAVVDNDGLNMVAYADNDGQRVIESWKKGITDVGQQFSSAHEFRDALQKYALAHRFLYTIKKNDSHRVTVKCKTDGCPWRIHASWAKIKKVFRVKKINKSHTCGGHGSSLQPQAVKDWLIGLVKDKLLVNPHYTPREITWEFERDFGIQLNYYQAYRGIELAREQLQGSYKAAYNLLPWFVEKVLETNPGSIARIIRKEGLHFQRLFVSYHASLIGFQSGCRPVLFLDSTSLNSKYHEVLLGAFGVDGEDGTLPVAFAIVDVEDDDSWHWFLEQLKSVVSDSQSITFISDKHKGLSKHVHELFVNAHHGYSMHHLMNDMKVIMRGYGDGKGSLTGNFLAAAHAFRVDEFNKCIERIRGVSLETYNWILDSEPEYWANSQFKGEPYNHITCNVMEPFKNWIAGTRGLPIIKKMDVLQSEVVGLICKRQEDSSKWCTRLTPSKEAKLAEVSQKARALKVLFSSASVFEVHDDSINVVNVDERDCSCQEWKMTGLPCCHAISVFNCIGKCPYDYCPRYFVSEIAKLAYSESIKPTPEIGKFDEIKCAEGEELHPPCPRTRQSDASLKRKDPESSKRPHLCSGCKEEGHHKTTCKIPKVF